MREIWHKGVKVYQDDGNVKVYASAERSSWTRMDKLGWPVEQMGGFMKQTEAEIAEALKAYRG